MPTPPRPDLRELLTAFAPRPLPYRHTDYARAVLGALLGLIVAYYGAKIVGVGPATVPFIVAPMGASAVLLFAASSSPLAQPWAVLVGNVVSALIGVAAGRWIDNVSLAAALAVAVAIGAMMLLRCLHPPGGACALFSAVAAPAVRHQGYLFAVTPIAVDTVCLLAIALLVNNLTGRTYPHVPAPAPAVPASPAQQRVGLQQGDIDRAMARLGQGLDVFPADVLALVRDAESHALERQFGDRRVGDVMAADVLTALAHETVFRVRVTMNNNRVKAVPIVDEQRRVIGIVTIFDLFGLGLANLDPVSKIMTSPVTTVQANAPVSELIALMTTHGLRHVPVVSADQQLVGIVTRTELVAVLNRALVSARGGARSFD